MRRLNRQVLAGGVVHPAGTAATDDLEHLITNEEFWTDDEIDISEEEHQEAALDESASDVQSDRESALAAEVERLTLENDELRAALADGQGVDPASDESETGESEDPADDESDESEDDEPESEDDEPVDDTAPEDYSEHGVKELRAELKLRNTGREVPIEVGGSGNKQDLIDALVADDQAQG